MISDEERSASKVNLLDNITSRALVAARCHGDVGNPSDNSDEQHVEMKHQVGTLRSKFHRRETRNREPSKSSEPGYAIVFFKKANKVDSSIRLIYIRPALCRETNSSGQT